MELPDDSYLMVDETMQEIFNERPQYRSTHKGQPPARVQSEAPAVELIEQQSDDNERVEKEVGIVTDLGLAHPLISTERNSTLQLFRNCDAKATARKPFLVAVLSLQGCLKVACRLRLSRSLGATDFGATDSDHRAS
jgi:hypothetical protein